MEVLGQTKAPRASQLIFLLLALKIVFVRPAEQCALCTALRIREQLMLDDVAVDKLLIFMYRIVADFKA